MSLSTIDFKKNAIASVTEVEEATDNEYPWDGIAKPITTKTVKSMLKEAGLDWHVDKVQATYQVGSETYEADNQFALVKSDTKDCLGVGSARYNPVQPEQIMKLYKSFSDKYDFEVSFAGQLESGKRIFALIDTKDMVDITSDDEYKVFLLAATSYDRTQSTKMSAIIVRTATGAVLEVPNSDLPVSHRTDFSIGDMTKGLEKIQAAVALFTKTLEKLASKKVDKEAAFDYLINIMANGAEEISVRKQNQISLAFELFANESKGCKLKTKGSELHLLMSYCEFIDFQGANYSCENRLKSALFTTGLSAKLNAYKEIGQV